MSTALNTSITPQFRTIDELQIRFAQRAAGGSQDPTILLTSPWPESLYAFAPMWTTLAAHARLVAIDLPGFGASERREDLLSPRAMGEYLDQLIVEALVCGSTVVQEYYAMQQAQFTVTAFEFGARARNGGNAPSAQAARPRPPNPTDGATEEATIAVV